jgi:hypothetical protein
MRLHGTIVAAVWRMTLHVCGERHVLPLINRETSSKSLIALVRYLCRPSSQPNTPPCEGWAHLPAKWRVIIPV